MHPDIDIRPYGEEYLPLIRILHDRAFRQLAAHAHDAAQLQAHADLIAGDDYALDVARSNLLLAFHSEAGLVATAGWLPLAERPDTARIRKVFVDPDWARRGLARRLVTESEARARNAGYPYLFVRANINAVPLYLSLGYVEESRGIMPAGSENLPVVFMSKRTNVQ